MNRSTWLCLLLAALAVPSRGAEPKRRKSPDKKPPTEIVQPAAPGARVEGASSDQPGRVLSLWSDGPAVDWRAQAETTWAQAEKSLRVLDKLGSTGSLKGRVAAVGRAHVALLQLKRAQVLLGYWWEPAAADIDVRHAELRKRLDTIVAELRRVHAGKFQDNTPQFIERAKKFEKTLPSIRKLIDSGKLEVAEVKLLKLFDDLAPQSALDPTFQPFSFEPFEPVMAELTKQLQPLRKRAGIDAIVLAFEQAAPNYAELLTEVGQAASALGSGRKVTVDGQPLDGPQVVERFLARWQKLHFKALRERALEWALLGVKEEPGNAKCGERYQTFEHDFTAAIVKLIDADAGSLPQDSVRKHYVGYLAALAPTLSLVVDPALGEEYQSALERLAQKSPAVAAEVSAYRLATSGPLRWRARLAAAEAAQAIRSAPAADLTQFRSVLQAPPPETIRSLADKALGRPAAGKAFIGSADSHLATSALDAQQAYCVVRLDDRLQATISSLRSLLLAGDSQQPLTLEAALALVRAERGDLVEAGGPITQLEYVGLIPLWARADTSDWGLTRLGMPAETDKGVPLLGTVRLRVEFKPRWYQLPHAFVALSADE
jgi:hypothetical protein